MSAIRTQIIQQLATELRAITIANGYSFDCRQVYVAVPNQETLNPQGIQPCIFIWPGTEAKDLLEFIGGVYNELDIHIAFSGNIVQNALDVGADMASDIERVILGGTPRQIAGATVECVPQAVNLYISSADEFQIGGQCDYVAQYTTTIGAPQTKF